MNTLQHMTILATAYSITHNCSEETIVEILVAGFSGQLKGWWDNYLSDYEKSKILGVVKTEPDETPISSNREPIRGTVNTLIFTIAQHFIGDPTL